MHPLLDDVAAWMRAGARRNRVARVRLAVRSTLDEDRAALGRWGAALVAEAALRADVPRARHLEGLRNVVFMQGTHAYTVDLVADGSHTSPCVPDVTFVVVAAA